MRIAFYECGDWEREYLAASPLNAHDLSFSADLLKPEDTGAEVEALSVFIYSPVTASTPRSSRARDT